MSLPTDITPDNPDIQEYFVSDFSGGLRLNMDSTKIGENEYLFLKNARNRFGRIRPVRKPLNINKGIPEGGSIQGLYGAGNFLLLIKNGNIYYRNFLDDPGGYWKIISTQYRMSTTAERVYVELVPASTSNYIRLGNADNPNGALNFDTNISASSPQAALVMDGVTQPLVISPTGLVRQSQTFAQWTLEKREYIPKGIMPMYQSNTGILWIVSPNRKELYHSVTGRPMDFVQAVDDDGFKIQDGAFTEEASRLAHKVDFEDITSIGRIPTPEGLTGGFFVSTINFSRLVVPNFDGPQFFGEPGFSNIDLFPTGAVNEKCLADILGDTALIDIHSIVSFNAIQQLKFSGKNSRLSQNVAPYFEDTVQNVAAAANFDNYAIFSVTTIYGPALLIYDTLTQSWVGLDIYEGVGQIQQFAQIKIAGIHRVFFYDDNNDVYEMFADDTVADWQFYKEWSTNNPKIEQKLGIVKCIFQNVLEDGEVTITDFMDRRQGSVLPQLISKNVDSTTTIPPFNGNTDRISNKVWKFPESKDGYKIGLLIEGDTDLELTSIQLNALTTATQVSSGQAAEVYENN